MEKTKLFISVLVMSVVLFSCSSKSEFAKVKYLDKTYVKKSKIEHKPEKFNNETAFEAVQENLHGKKSDQALVNAREEDALQEEEETVMTASQTPLEIIGSPVVEPVVEIPARGLQEIYSHIPKESVRKEKPAKAPASKGLGDLLLVLLAILVPPLAVLLKRGFDAHFWLNLILSLFYGGIFFGFPYLLAIPVIHALLVVLDVFP